MQIECQQERRLYPHCGNFNFAQEENLARRIAKAKIARRKCERVTTCKSHEKARNGGGGKGGEEYIRSYETSARERLLRERQMRRKFGNAPSSAPARDVCPFPYRGPSLTCPVDRAAYKRQRATERLSNLGPRRDWRFLRASSERRLYRERESGSSRIAEVETRRFRLQSLDVTPALPELV